MLNNISILSADTEALQPHDVVNGESRTRTLHGIVLAGVHAWGEHVLEKAACRPLLPVTGRPLIAHSVDWMRRQGIDNVTICGNSSNRIIRGALGLGEDLGVTLSYCDDDVPRGPAGCVRDAAASTGADVFIVMESVIVPDVNLDDILEMHLRTGAAVTMAVTCSEKAPGGRTQPKEPVGIYVFSRQALSHVSARGYQDIKECLLPALHRKGERIATYEVRPSAVQRIRDASSYLQVNMAQTQRLLNAGEPSVGSVRRGDAWIDKTARVDESVRIVGPVLVGADCVIEPGVTLVGPTTVGKGCFIGRDAVISRSAIWDDCTVQPGAILDHCVFTQDTVAEADVVYRETIQTQPARLQPGLWERLSHCWRPEWLGGRGGMKLQPNQ